MRMMRAITRFSSDEGAFSRGEIFKVASDERAAYLIGIHVAEDYGPAPDANKAYAPTEKKVIENPVTIRQIKPTSDTGKLKETGKAKRVASSVAARPSPKAKRGKPTAKKR